MELLHIYDTRETEKTMLSHRKVGLEVNELDSVQVTESSASVSSRSKTGFVGDVLKLVSGATLAQSIGILITPVLTRLYPPEAFGVLELFTSIAAVLGVIACMRYELAIMLPESDEEAANLLGVSLGFVVLLTLLTIPVVWWGRVSVLSLLNAQELIPYSWFIPPMVFVAGVFLALNYWNSRTKRFGRLSIARIVQSSSVNLIKLGAGFAGHVTGGVLIGANVIGQAIASVALGWQIWRDDGKIFLRSINWDGMRLGVQRHRRFPLISTWSALLNTTAWRLPPILLIAFFSSGVAGHYAMASRVLHVPLGLIGSAVGQVFFQRAAKAQIEGQLASLVEKTFRQLVNFGLFPMLMLMLVGRDAFAMVLGSSWAEAGTYAQIMSIWLFLQFITSPMTTLATVLERQEIGLFRNIIFLIANVLAFWLGGRFGDARLALGVLSVFGCIIYGSLCLILAGFSGVAYTVVFRILLLSVLKWLPAGLLIALLKFLGISPLLILTLIGIMIIIYYIYLWRDESFNLQIWK